ncbi:MAG: beta-ketoacyl-ACP synthase II [Deltaproteobacteria bacterium]|nr:beta-ketoacyl-ACP synthase II [Deltaproteobacteria bacterium]
MTTRRVVITGLGVVAANGIGVSHFWESNISGRPGINRITSFDASHYPSQVAAEVSGFDPLLYMPDKVAKRVDRFVHFGLAAAKMALDDSGLNLGSEDPERIGVIIGSGLGGVLFHEAQIMEAYEKVSHRFNPLCVPRITPNAVAAHIAIQYGLLGPNFVISTACASGNHGIGEAHRKIQHGEADVVVAGGAEAPLTEFTFGAYCALRGVLSKKNDPPHEASRPFDRDRDGFVMGEGGAVLILEELGHALKRGAHIYAEIVGYGLTSGAYHIAMPEPAGEDAARTIMLALSEAHAPPEEVDYINAHGTGTTANDWAETKGIKRAFGDFAYRIPVSSTKSMIGHSIGAAGAIEGVVSCLAIAHQMIPPTINLTHPDPECDLDYVPNKARDAKIDLVLSNSFGFGSVNACLLFKKFD